MISVWPVLNVIYSGVCVCVCVSVSTSCWASVCRPIGSGIKPCDLASIQPSPSLLSQLSLPFCLSVSLSFPLSPSSLPCPQFSPRHLFCLCAVWICTLKESWMEWRGTKKPKYSNKKNSFCFGLKWKSFLCQQKRRCNKGLWKHNLHINNDIAGPASSPCFFFFLSFITARELSELPQNKE